jgi:ABC-2 type transport system permease protein
MLLWLAIASYMTVEVLVFRNTYPDAASRQKLLELSTSTMVRTMQGVPGAVDTAGGFAVWDGGWMVTVIVATWALLTITRLTRGEEDTGRAELVLSRPVTSRQALAANLSTMALALVGLGLAAALPFVLLGQAASGAALWGAGIAAFAATITALGALVAQIVEPRRRASAVGFGGVAVAFMLRFVANSADSRDWILSLSPFGWVDRLRAFSDNHALWLAAPTVAVLVLGGAAFALCSRRDTGAALLRSSTIHRSRLGLLGSAAAFGWRLTSGALLAWASTLALVSLVFGLMTAAFVDFAKDDETYRKMLTSMGMDMSAPAVGFMCYLAGFLALAFAAFLGWRIGAIRQEEAEGHLDNLLVRGVVRWRWLAVTAVHGFLAAAVLVVATGSALWAGAELCNAPIRVSQVVEPMAGTLPLVVLFTGLAVLVFGLRPRLTIALTVTLAVVTYLLDSFGAMLKWPESVLGLSPFHHLARLPGHPMTLTAAVAMTAVGVLAAAAGIAAFARRDLSAA